MHKKIDRETKAGESHLPKGLKEPFLGVHTRPGIASVLIIQSRKIIQKTSGKVFRRLWL